MYGVFSVPAWASVRPTWHKLCNVPLLSPLFQMHWSSYSALYKSSGHNILIHVDEKNKILFILWCYSCSWLSRMWLVFYVTIGTAEKHPPRHLTVLTSPVDVCIRAASIDECVCDFFCIWRNSVQHLCFICTSTSGVILLDCTSAAICHHMVTKCSGILAGRFSLYCIPPPSTSDVVGQRNKIGDITLGTAFTCTLITIIIK